MNDVNESQYDFENLAFHFFRKMEMVIGQTYWPIGDIISGAHDASATAELIPYLLGACIVLNCPLLSHDLLASLFARFQTRICADGAANLIYDTFPAISLEPESCPYIPDAVVGDLDSLRPDVRSYMESNGVRVHQMPDQDSTDLDKSLRFYEETLPSDASIRFVAILGTLEAYEGRSDQAFAVYNSMYSNRSGRMRLISVGKENVSLVLSAGSHRIEVPLSSIGKHCGIVPIFGKVDSLTTSGFEWNMAGQPTEFGAIVSTNNIMRSQLVAIDTSGPIMFTFVY